MAYSSPAGSRATSAASSRVSAWSTRSAPSRSGGRRRKIVGRQLAPFLAGFSGFETPPEPPHDVATTPIEVEVDADEVDRLTPPLEAADESTGTVAEVMSTDPLVVAPEDTLAEATEQMRARDYGSAAVAAYGHLLGILTSRDLLRALASHANPSEAHVREWMTAEPVAVHASADVAAAVALMNEHRIHHLPVVDGDRLVGMIGYRQAVRAGRGLGVGLGF